MTHLIWFWTITYNLQFLTLTHRQSYMTKGFTTNQHHCVLLEIALAYFASLFLCILCWAVCLSVCFSSSFLTVEVSVTLSHMTHHIITHWLKLISPTHIPSPQPSTPQQRSTTLPHMHPITHFVHSLLTRVPLNHATLFMELRCGVDGNAYLCNTYWES